MKIPSKYVEPSDVEHTEELSTVYVTFLEDLCREQAEAITNESPTDTTLGMVCHFCEIIISWERHKKHKNIFEHEPTCPVLKSEEYLNSLKDRGKK